MSDDDADLKTTIEPPPFQKEPPEDDALELAAEDALPPEAEDDVPPPLPVFVTPKGVEPGSTFRKVTEVEETPGRINFARLDELSQTDPALFEDAAQDPPFARQVKTTPLHFYVASESLTNLWCIWNGHTVADRLTNLEDEYAALRNSAALTDISPLFKYRISGGDAFIWLRRLVTGNLSALSIDEIMPVVFCEDRGFVVGDGLLCRLGESEFRLITEEPHLAWLLDSAIGHHVRIEDVSSTLAAVSVQGPLSCAVLVEAGFERVEALRPYTARWFDVVGMPVYVSRSGSSGDLGYEIWVDPEDAPAIWIRLAEKGKIHGLKVGGFALREVSRVEAGIPRAGVDYIGAFSAVDPQSALTPYELGFSSQVDLDAEHFTGRDALRRAKVAAPRQILATVAIDWPAPIAFNSVRDATQIVGVVTSRVFSPALGCNLALAVLRPQAVVGGSSLHVEAEMRDELSLRQVRASARIIAGPALLLPARHLVPAPISPKR
jgi:aminomethyltransferase